MEFDPERERTSDRTWRAYLIVLILMFGAFAALQVYQLFAEGETETRATSAIFQGDVAVKMSLAPFAGAQRQQLVNQALRSYRRALPSADAYRRIGVLKQTLLSESGLKSFDAIDSPEVTEGLEKDRIRQLSREAEMWREIYTPPAPTVSEVRAYVSRIRELDLGPLKELALADVYELAGETKRAEQLRQDAEEEATARLMGVGAIVVFLVVTGLVGIIIASVFLGRYGKEIEHSPRPDIQPAVLMITFIVYAISLVVLQSVAVSIVDAVDGGGNDTLAWDVVAQIVASLGSMAVALFAFAAITRNTREDLRELGFRAESIGWTLKWALGAYAALLPFWVAAIVIWQLLAGTLFEWLPAPVDPYSPAIAEGGVTFILFLIIAAIVAPLVEETFFRGVLYNGLRGRLGVWGAALLSSAFFAMLHPFPHNFLPIVVVGVVLALLREKTGSLAPPIICHSVYNTIILALAYLLYT